MFGVYDYVIDDENRPLNALKGKCPNFLKNPSFQSCSTRGFWFILPSKQEIRGIDLIIMLKHEMF